MIQSGKKEKLDQPGRPTWHFRVRELAKLYGEELSYVLTYAPLSNAFVHAPGGRFPSPHGNIIRLARDRVAHMGGVVILWSDYVTTPYSEECLRETSLALHR